MTAATGLLIHKITPLCQLQDLGRPGYQRYGVSRGGAMDPYSLRLANILVGNAQDEACLEFALAGAVFEVTAKRIHVGFVGNFPVLINEEEFPPNASYTLMKGERLEIVASDGANGTHAYLAVAGGFDAQKQLGSRATHLRSGLGGFEQPIKPGATLPTRLDEAPLSVERELPARFMRRPGDIIRAIQGPQLEFFSEEATGHFLATTWRIEPNSDRMGYRLGGSTIQVESAGSMISEGVCAGCVQVPAGGSPIVLMADCGTIGGYPKIATVIGVDRGRLAQMRVGREFGFEDVSVEAAQGLYRDSLQALSDLEQQFC